MAKWEAVQDCYVLGVQLSAGQIIELTDDNEKSLGIGKYVKKVVNTKTNKESVVGYKHLRQMDRSRMDERMAVDGMIVHPPTKPFSLVHQ